MSLHHRREGDSLLTPDEETELMNAIPTPKTSSSTSSSSSTTTSAGSSSTDDWDTNSSTSSASSSSTTTTTTATSTASATKAPPPSAPAPTLLTINCDVSTETQSLFSSLNNAWLLRENGFALEKVRLWYYDQDRRPSSFSASILSESSPVFGTAGDLSGSRNSDAVSPSNGWQYQEQMVVVSTNPFSVGAMRASFYLVDVTRQVAPNMIEERLKREELLRRHRERTSTMMTMRNGTTTTATTTTPATSASATGKFNSAASAIPFDYLLTTASNSSLLAPSLCSFKQPLLELPAWSSSSSPTSVVSSNRELYVAKSYRRYLIKRFSALTSSDRKEEMARHFRDAHMQGVAQHWVEQMNALRPPCPRLNFVPVWVMQRLQPVPISSSSSLVTTTTATSNSTAKNTAPAQPQLAASASTSSSSSSNNDNDNNFASSKSCEFLSVEPMLLGGVFTKHNNNNGFVKGRRACGEGRNSTTEDLISSLEMETRDAANALLHFSYKMSARTLMVCDLQGMGTLMTDPQIHTIDGQAFGRGNLGAKGMYHCVKSHKCNKVCQALKLEKFDVELERVYLKQMDRKQRTGELLTSGVGGSIAGGEVPAELERMTAAKHMDFDF